MSNKSNNVTVVTCGKPETKDDKTIVEASSFSVGGKASYSCIYGLELVGDDVRTCQANGQWSSEIPYCRRKLSLQSDPDYGNFWPIKILFP